MTALVSLLFIAMIPIDCKLQFFPHTCTVLKANEQGWLPTPADILVGISSLIQSCQNKLRMISPCTRNLQA